MEELSNLFKLTKKIINIYSELILHLLFVELLNDSPLPGSRNSNLSRFDSICLLSQIKSSPHSYICDWVVASLRWNYSPGWQQSYDALNAIWLAIQHNLYGLTIIRQISS